MKARAVPFLLVIALAGFVPAQAGHTLIDAGGGASMSVGASWETSTHRMFAALERQVYAGMPYLPPGVPDGVPDPASMTLYVAVVKITNGADPGIPLTRPTTAASHFDGAPVCMDAMPVAASQHTYDPAMESASVTNVDTACGIVTVNWRAIAPPSAGGGADHFLPGSFFPFAYAGGGGRVARAASAEGRIGKFSVPSHILNGASFYAGAGAALFAQDFDVTYSARAFRAIGGKFRKNGTSASISVVEYAARIDGMSMLGAGVATAVPARACVEVSVVRRLSGRTRTLTEFGCGIVTLEMDPALGTAKVVGSVGSMSLDLSFTATDAPASEYLYESELNPDYDPAYGLPSHIIDAEAYVSRPGSTAGTIRSRKLGATVQPAFSNLLLAQGVHGTIFRGYPFFDEE